MRSAAVWWSIVVCGCWAATPPIRFGAGKSHKEAEQQRYAELMPAPLVPTGKWTGELRVAKVRVWADDEYRAQNVHWEETFDDELDAANEILEPMLGLQLQADYHAWDRHAPTATMEDDLAALAQQDPGDGAFTVIGLTSSIPLLTATFDKLGIAALGGNHMVLRGYADVEQRKAFELIFKDLPARQREILYAARRRHETTSLILHELGHNLGLPHLDGTDTIMNWQYSEHESHFTDDERATMLLSADQHLPGSERGLPNPVVAAPGPAMPPDLQASIAVAEKRLGDGDVAGARAALVTEEVEMVQTPPGDPATAWLALADEYRKLGAVSRAEAALAKSGATAPADHGIAAWAAMTRVRYGVPRDGSRYKLAPDEAGDAVVAVRQVIALSDQGAYGDAAKAAAAAAKRWPELPGLLAAQCDLELRSGALAVARRLCGRAMARNESSWAFYLGGILFLQDTSGTSTRHGILALQHAIQLDPDLGQAWRALAKAYEREHATSALDELRRDYQTRFGSALP